MLAHIFELAFTDSGDIPAPDAADQVLVRWLRQRLGRPPSWFEVLELRAGLKERARRLVRWAWWRRLRRPVLPEPEHLVADFLRCPEGQILLRMVGSMGALLLQLGLPDPWYGYDARHPQARRLSRRETIRERVSRGGVVPVREQAAAVLAYAEWKLSCLPVATKDSMPEAVEFLASVHAAAINAMNIAAVMGICACLHRPSGGETGQRAILRELDRVGGEALRLWPGMGRPAPGAPLGLLPVAEAPQETEETEPVPDSMVVLGI